MTDHDDDLLHHLRALDPTIAEPPPGRGSSRHDEILERAMTTTRSPAAADLRPGRSDQPDRPDGSTGGQGRRRRPRLLVAAAVAAVVVAAVGVVVTLEPDREPSPAAAVTAAAENTGAELTLRSVYRRDDGRGGLDVVRSEHRGADVRRRFSTIDADGTERTRIEGDDATVYIGRTGWITDGAEVTEVTVDPSERNAPYSVASAAIVEATVTEATVIEIGDEEVRGSPATRYRIRLDDAAIRRLDALPANQRSGFELEDPSAVRRLEVWIGDGHLRRIRVVQDRNGYDSTGTTVEFYDFGADITVEPPT